MLILKKVSELEDFVALNIRNHHSIGFVPTMGALHDGHLSLVKRCVDENDVSVVSVFVNPTQFNNPSDLATYPRREEEDFKMLAAAGVDAVFAPAVDEIYPDGADKGSEHIFNLGSAAEVMEGKFRPGHFQGVAQIVSRLFRLCRPTRAYFGEKDFQQIAVIRNMIVSEDIKVDIVACPIKRDSDGLALSSRNALLSADQRRNAPAIYSTLKEAVDFSHSHTVEQTHKMVVDKINSVPEMRVEYFEIVDARTLLPVDDWIESENIVGCITVYNGDVRLIDNIRFRG